VFCEQLIIFFLYRTALSISPRFIDAKVNLGASYYNSGNFSEVEKIFIECLKQSPNDDKIKQYLANAMKMTKQAH